MRAGSSRRCQPLPGIYETLIYNKRSIAISQRSELRPLKAQAVRELESGEWANGYLGPFGLQRGADRYHPARHGQRPWCRACRVVAERRQG